MSSGIDVVLRTGQHARVARVAAVVRVVAGVLFVVFGTPKFTDHAKWVADFGRYGLPQSDLLVYGTGLVEILGGLLLIAGVLVGPVAAVLALVMIGAVTAGGIVGGNPTSLTLAPALLLAALFVLWSVRRGGVGRTPTAGRDDTG